MIRTKEDWASELFDRDGLDMFENSSELYEYLSKKGTKNYQSQVKEIAISYSAGALNLYIEKVLEGLYLSKYSNEYLLPTMLVTRYGDPNHKKLTRLRKDKISDFSKQENAVIICAFIEFLNSYFDNRIEFPFAHYSYIPQIALKPASKAIFKGVRATVKALLKGIVAAGRLTDPSYSLGRLLQENDETQILSMLESNFRHDHTDYNLIDGWLDVESASGHSSYFWKGIGTHMRNSVKEIFLQNFDANDLIKEVNRVKQSYFARRSIAS